MIKFRGKCIVFQLIIWSSRKKNSYWLRSPFSGIRIVVDRTTEPVVICNLLFVALILCLVEWCVLLLFGCSWRHAVPSNEVEDNTSGLVSNQSTVVKEMLLEPRPGDGAEMNPRPSWWSGAGDAWNLLSWNLQGCRAAERTSRTTRSDALARGNQKE